MWYLDTYAKDARAFCGHYFELEDLFPEVAEEESRNRELDPLRNFVPVDQLEKSYRDPHDVEFDNSPPIFSSQEEDEEYAKAYDEWIDANAPKENFNLSLGDQDLIVEMEIVATTANCMPQKSLEIESMSPYKMLHKFSRGNRKENKYIYNSMRIDAGKPDKRTVHLQRTRGRINPPRRRMERHEKLSSLFAYERYVEELDREHNFFQKEMARAM